MVEPSAARASACQQSGKGTLRPEARAIFPHFGGLNSAGTATIFGMHLAILGMRILEVMFFVGLAGSTIVVLISFIEDAKELFGEE